MKRHKVSERESNTLLKNVTIRAKADRLAELVDRLYLLGDNTDCLLPGGAFEIRGWCHHVAIYAKQAWWRSKKRDCLFEYGLYPSGSGPKAIFYFDERRLFVVDLAIGFLEQRVGAIADDEQGYSEYVDAIADLTFPALRAGLERKE